MGRRPNWSSVLGLLGFAGLMTGAASAVRSVDVPPQWLERPADATGADGGQLDWRARYSPPSERPRLRATIDRGPDEALELLDEDGIALRARPLSPGLHFVELTMERRGGRVSRITDEVWAGPWQSERERGCDVGLVLSPEGLRQLLLPVVETKLLAGARDNPYFGSTSVLARSDLEVVDGGLRFAVFLDTEEEGKGDLSVAGVIDVQAQGDAGIVARLRSLDEAAPGPKLEAMARAEGGRRLGAIGVTVGGGLVAAAGGGALLGLAAATGGGYLGRKYGAKLGERTARREVRREAAVQIERALQVATNALRLPKDVVVLPTDPELRADLRWCEEPSLVAGAGLRATLRVAIHDDEASHPAAAQAVFLDTALPEPSPPTTPDFNLHVDVSGDFLNRLIAEWTVRGGLQSRLDASGLADEVQDALGDRTRWRVEGLGVERSPVVTLGPQGQIDTAIGGVVLEFVDPERAGARTVVLGATGVMALEALPEPGRVRLGGTLRDVYLACREQSEELERRRPCFSSAVDPEVLGALLDEQLRARSNSLPVLDLGGVLRLETFGADGPSPVTLDDTAIEPRAGHLSIDARLR